MRRASRFLALSVLAALCLWAAGCSLPRIAVHDDPLSPAEHLQLGQAYEAKGEAEAAAREYELAARRLPAARLYLGNVRFGQGRLDQAEAAYREVIRTAPDNAEAYNNLAWLLYTRQEKLDEAEELAAKAVALEPGRAAFRDTLEQVRRARAGFSPG